MFYQKIIYNFILLQLYLIRSNCLPKDYLDQDDGVEIYEDDFEDENIKHDYYANQEKPLKRIKKDTDNILKSYIDNLKNVILNYLLSPKYPALDISI